MDFERRFTPQPQSPDIELFRTRVLKFYAAQGRSFPWRQNTHPYSVFVSEVMLQQTQVYRVEPKYLHWMQEVPDFRSLAKLSTERLIGLWQGLGYNRRALALRNSAIIVTKEYGGILPDVPELLQSLPGIGPATAASICAFAFNKPVVFIETNIRRVFIHFFFRDSGEVNDKDILPLVEASLYRESPRDWYNALMDLGTLLRSRGPNPNRKSRHYTRQAPFEGSNREARGAILKALQGTPFQTTQEISKSTGIGYARIERAVEELTAEGFLTAEEGQYGLK
ncbi:A/G-specific adenine glycosylase [Marispirochaeta sp.]|uniref:A/G-specific adenine glycosylase n=1 Tax=Marispirochaeta sp. TaxID=2038653 RepID=UPI0029C91B37|nr:A/G-specific adenine glycosylase [Marispirochaeta sp.]